MVTKVRKWGNSLGLRIPKALAEEASVGEGSSVDLRLVSGEIVVRPLKKRFELKRLLAEVSADNLHAEVSTGEPAGRESW